MIRRIEIGIIANGRRQVHHDILLSIKNSFPQADVVTQRRIVRGEQVLNNFACFAPGRAAKSEKFVQGLFRENTPELALKFFRFEMTEAFQNGEIDHPIADGNTGPGHTIAWAKNSKGQILEREVRVRRDVDE
jgi:hypothetical protein